MDPGDQDAKHPLLDHTPLRPYDTTLHRPYSHLQANPAHAVSQPGHLTLPPPPGQAPRSSVPIQPSYHRPGPPPSSGPPRAFPQPNNNPSPPTGTSHSDPRYSPPTAHPHGVTYQRSYSVDSGVQRSTNLPAQPGGEGRPPVSAGGLPSSEALGPSMDHHVPHGPPYVEHPPPNGMVHGSQHGMPLLPHHEQYPQHPQGGPPPGVPHGYAPPPPQYAATPYPQAPYPHQQATQFPRKKANRATQACQQCRARKQKCDEQRPCGFCEKEGHSCEYKETAPPKQDQTMLQILDRLTSIDSKLSHIDPDGSAGTKRKRSYAAEMGEDESPRYTKSPATSSSQKVEDIEYEQSDETTIPQSAVSEQMPPLETDFGQPLNHVPSGRSQSAVFGQDREENETLKPGQEEPAPGGIPADHTTSVEHLKTWSLINQFYVDSHHEDEPSVTAHEKMQGFLRIFGVGQTGDDIKKETAGQNESMAAPSPASDDSNPVDIGGLWGAGFNDGYLRLDEATLRRLEENYFKNFAILHPFLDRSRFKRMLIYFTKTYSNPTPGSSSSPPFEDTSSTSSSSRKSRNNYDIITWADFSKNFPSHKPIERTLNNAIVLLVLALGRMAEHREPLTGPVAPYTGTSAINYSPRSAPSPSTYTKASPATSHNTMSMTPSPNMSEARNYGMSRAPSHEGRPLLAGGKELRNIDVIPGLAYYGFATEIIHSFASAMDFGMGDPLLQVWAFLLAGLYMGQLARVMESFGWIDKACKAWLRLKDKYDKEDLFKESKDKNIDLVKLAFWTCLQLESDIRAELDFPDPGIGKYEDLIGLPNSVFEDPNAPNLSEASDVYIYYSLQIHFRKTLNRAHSLVYKPGVEYIAPKSILEGLQGIRDVIEGFEKPQALRGWNDDDPTSPDINVSRIRGKYYGARYIILRPFLQHALSIMKPRYVQIQNVGASDEIPQMRLLDLRARDNRRKHEDRDEETVLGIIRGTKGCIDAAMSSTIAFDGLSPDRFLVTNIHGTALAQYGNMLVLSAAYMSWLGPTGANLIPRGRLIYLLHRTIKLMNDLSSLSNIMSVNADVLRAALRKVEATHDPFSARGISGGGNSTSGLQSAHSSFGPST